MTILAVALRRRTTKGDQMPEAQSLTGNIFRRAITGAVMLSAATLTATNGNAQSQPASVKFTAKECEIVNNLLLDEIKTYKPRPNGPNSNKTQTLIKSAFVFIGLDRDQMTCDGTVINWSTRGDKSILDAVALRIFDLERARKIPTKGLTDKFISVIGKNSQSASLEPHP
jgi:hypothetical protein